MLKEQRVPLHHKPMITSSSNVKTNKDDEDLEKEEITTTTTPNNKKSSHENVAFLQTETETEETKEEWSFGGILRENMGYIIRIKKKEKQN